MKPSNTVHGWLPIATSAELTQKKILSRKFRGVPIVIFRDPHGKAAVLHDRCPHRFAPLSLGQLKNGELVCPYHGWQFNSVGQCTRVPGLDCAPSTASLIEQYPVQEMHGLVWISDGLSDVLIDPPLRVIADTDAFLMSDTVASTPAAIAENFLDGFHTHFVHAGWIRTDSRRQMITARLHTFCDGVEVVYHGEQKQSGIISRWLEPSRGISIGRFRLPGLAEIEYQNAAGQLTMLASTWLTPVDDTRTQVHVRIATRRHWIPATLKHALLRRLFNVILQQDKKILEVTAANQYQFSKTEFATQPLSSANDLLSHYINELYEKGFLQESDSAHSIRL